MQVDLSGPVYTISNVILYAMMMASINVLLKSRFNRVFTFLLEVCSSVGFFLISVYIPMLSPYRILIGFVYLCILISILHIGNPFYKILVVSLVFTMMLLAEAFYVMLVPRELIANRELYLQHDVSIFAFYLFVNLTMQIILVLVVFLFQKKYSSGILSGTQWLLLGLFPVSQCLLVSAWFSSYTVSDHIISPWRVIPMLLFCVGADFAVIYAFYRTAYATTLAMKNKYLNEQVEYQTAFYKELSRSIEETRKMRHDIDNHLFTIKALLRDGQTEEAATYTESLTKDDTARLAFPGCQNAVAASYLNGKRASLLDVGIPCDMEVQIPSGLSIENPDLICILGNLMDNAQEAAKACESPYISLAIAYVKPYLRIVCRNPYLPNPEEKKDRRIAEMDRGIGHTILQQLAEKYDGTYETKSAEEEYEVLILLKSIPHA